MQDPIAGSENADTKSVIDDTLPIAKLIVLDGFLTDVPVRVLKDDRCNNNVIS